MNDSNQNTNLDSPTDDETDFRMARKAAQSSKRGSGLQTPLETYLREINDTNLLNAQEERDLAHAIAQGDVRARDRMVRANLRLVVNIARPREQR